MGNVKFITLSLSLRKIGKGEKNIYKMNEKFS
jgi:hypothetical protein